MKTIIPSVIVQPVTECARPNLVCQYGRKKDDVGCDLCECNPPPIYCKVTLFANTKSNHFMFNFVVRITFL